MSTQLRVGFKSVQGWRSYGAGAFLGIEPCTAGGTVGVGRLPTDSVGTFVLTLTGLVVGSAVQIETQSGTPIENRTATATTEVFSVPAFAVGNVSNDLLIKVRKGSAAPYYRPFETLATALVGAQSIFVNQIPD